jgi:peptidoglycan/LPS O-acetylase OafA/YrhL
MVFSARISIFFSALFIFTFFMMILAANFWNLPIVYMTFSLFGLFCLLIPCRPLILKNLLKTKSMLFLGRVSFSFYVLHWPIMLFLLSLMQIYLNPDFLDDHPFLKGLLLFVVSVCFALPLSGLTERFIERPFNALGHKISSLIYTSTNSKT